MAFLASWKSWPNGYQHSHFWNYAPELEKNSYAAVRYAEEYDRCFEVLERQLEGRHYIVDEYSIADIICWPWILIAKSMGRSLILFQMLPTGGYELKNVLP